MTTEIKLKSIAKEATACRKAFKGVKIGALVHCCHHLRHFEMLTEPAINRISYIIASKPKEEQAFRLHHFRPVPINDAWRKADAEYQKADAEYQKAYAEYQKAYAEYQEAYAEWRKSDADRQKAYAEYQKAYAEYQEAYAEWRKSDADRQKADDAWQKADDAWRKADDAWQKAYIASDQHDVDFPDCPWTGKSIFKEA